MRNGLGKLATTGVQGARTQATEAARVIAGTGPIQGKSLTERRFSGQAPEPMTASSASAPHRQFSAATNSSLSYLRHTDTSHREEHGGTEFTLSPDMIKQAVAIPFPPFRMDGNTDFASPTEVKRWIAQGINHDSMRAENEEARNKLKEIYNQA
jgi:hypothetical protein